MSLRRSSLPRHGRRALVASSMAAALIAVPGMALADELAPEAPAQDPSGVVKQLVDGVPVTVPGTGGTGTGGTGTGAAPEQGEDPLPPFEIPDELKAAFAQAGFSEDCVEGVSGGFEQLVGGLAQLADFEAFAADLQAALEELAAEQDPTVLPGLLEDLLGDFVPTDGAPPAASEDIVGGLQLILASLESCIPTPPGGEEPEPEPEPEPVAPVAKPDQQPPAPTQQAPQEVAAPVAYLGYAPTGADPARADDTSVPLTALGGGLVLVAAGAAGYGMRGRAVRTRD